MGLYGALGTGLDVLCYTIFHVTCYRNNVAYCISDYGPGVESASNRNEYQEYFLGGKSGRCVGLTTLPPSCADYLEIWEPHLLEPSGPVQACNGIDLPFTFTVYQSRVDGRGSGGEEQCL